MYSSPPALPPRRTLRIVLYSLLFLLLMAMCVGLMLLAFSSSDWSAGSESAPSAALTPSPTRRVLVAPSP